MLDVGCGHGLAASHLARMGHRGRYVGIDSSLPLIEMARRHVDAPWATFEFADLAEPGWCAPEDGTPFDWVLAFAVLHHLPGADLRRRIVAELRSLLRPGGRAAVSVWEFGASPRLRRHVVAWEEVGLAASDVEPGDALLDWRHDGYGVRYVHQFSPPELADLARGVGFSIETEFRSDGQGGQLGMYQVWKA